MNTTAARFALLGIDDEVTACDCCGKSDLKCTMALSELDVDGNEVAVVRFGRDCGARALGWRVSADRAEKLIRGTATLTWARLTDATATAGAGADYTRPVRVEIDGVTIEVWRAFYLGQTVPAGWTEARGGKGSDLIAWRVAPTTPDAVPSDDEVSAAVRDFYRSIPRARAVAGWNGDVLGPAPENGTALAHLRTLWPSLPASRLGRARHDLTKAGTLTKTSPNGEPLVAGWWRLTAR